MSGDESGRTPARVPPPRPDTESDPMRGGAAVGSLPRRIPQVLALAVVWVLLWGSLTATTLVGGLLVGLVVTLLFPLPLLPERMPVRPVKTLRLASFVLLDLLVSGIRVSAVTLRHGPRASAGIIGLPLYAESDRTATTIAAACALTPGSFVLQIDRRRNRWYVYALGLHRTGAVARVRRDMLTLQMRVVEAMGTDADIRGCRAALDALAVGKDHR
ncbi:Na+/H+ antiporter subunit E [Pseudonocardia nantongensis]|uniref:Na+/H+ antiporter subunit E n=1 Tax=Pseudonocardia nantongensis TaxID=1181885 RepID=UPI00397B51A8